MPERLFVYLRVEKKKSKQEPTREILSGLKRVEAVFSSVILFLQLEASRTNCQFERRVRSHEAMMFLLHSKKVQIKPKCHFT